MVRGKNECLTLEDIHNEYDKIVLDNCVLNGYLPDWKQRETKDCSEFANFLIDKIEKFSCFIPELIREEYLFGMNAKAIKNTKKGKLMKEFERCERILCVDDFPLGVGVKRGDCYCEKFGEKFGISKTDLRVVSWGIALSNYFDSAAIISNDINGIACFWNCLVNGGHINRKKLGFFKRIELDLYERFV